MIFDAGVFIALDKPSKRGIVLALVEELAHQGITPATNDAALAQAWRKPAQQVAMKKLVDATDVRPFGDPKTIGMVCAQTGTSDIADASLALLARQMDRPVLTTDPGDMRKLGVEFRKL